MNNIAIIPARGGSRRIPKKNIREFHGKPIIFYSLEAAVESGLFGENDLWVTTDDEEIAEIAEGFGATTIIRPPELAVDNVGTQEVTRHALLQMETTHIQYVCCIYPTAPLMSAEDLITGYAWLEDSRESMFAMSVGTNPLRDAAQFYWGTTAAFLNAVPLILPTTLMIPIEEKRVMDINTEDDWQNALMMYDSLHKEAP